MDSQHTREMDKNRENERNKDGARRGPEAMGSTPGSGGMSGNRSGSEGHGPPNERQSSEGGTLEQAKTMVRDVGEQAKSVARDYGEQARNLASSAGETAQDLARRAGVPTEKLYQQGVQAGEYLTRNVHEYPLTALLIAGAVGYGLGYLIHSRWTSNE
jgi:ElaB/YqjD/DUF883 family membrane-anchored ribosome-binding protein